MLNKELVLYERDEEGKLIPQKVKLELAPGDLEDNPELANEEILITPLTRGELKKLLGDTLDEVQSEGATDKDEDAEIIVKHCHSPKFTLEELAYAKPLYVRSIARTILIHSGIKFDTGGRKSIRENDEFSKN